MILIVVGVSLALIVNAWYGSRQVRQQEIRTLEQIEKALESDLAFLQDQVAVLREAAITDRHRALTWAQRLKRVFATPQGALS